MSKSTNNINVSSVVSPDILKTISTSTAINTFGSQLKDEAKEKIISSPRGKIAQLQSEKVLLEKDVIVAGLRYNTKVKQIEINKSQYPTEELYQKDLAIAKTSYEEEKISLELKIIQKNILIQEINNSPYDKIKDNENKVKSNIKRSKKKNQDSESKSKKDLIKQVTTNAAKTLAPIIALQLANSFTVLISQRKKLEDLVDQVNNYIDTQVKDETTVTVATNLRNNAILLINNNIAKLDRIKKTIDNITRILVVFGVIILILNLAVTFLPPLTPPGVVKKITDIINKATALISALSALLAIVSTLLANEITNLIELRNRLKEVSLKLDNKTIDNLNEQQLSDLSNLFLPAGGDYGSYKGFKFSVKEEQNNPQFIVKGNKRKYAVAIDRYGVEAIKSEFSFTQDPNDLIEQLKLIIDQQNLQG
jgi:hypothetical protein